MRAGRARSTRTAGEGAVRARGGRTGPRPGPRTDGSASSPAEGDPAGRGVTALWSRSKTSRVREGTAHGLHPAADPARAGCAVPRARPPRPGGPRTVLRVTAAPRTPAAHAVDAATAAPSRRTERRTDHAERTRRRRHGPSRVSGGSRSPPAFERLSVGGHHGTVPVRPTTALCALTRQAPATGRHPTPAGPGGIPEIATRRPATVRSARHQGNARGDVAQPTGVRP